MKHLFVVDDDMDIRILLKKYLTKEEYRVSDFSNAQDALAEVFRLKPDLVILDVSMPGMDGIELCKEIRKKLEIPIIFLSARSEEMDRIIGLEVGGDDYLTKPFSPRELMVRIKNIFRRIDGVSNRMEKSEVLRSGNLSVDIHRRYAFVCGENNEERELKLTSKELETLYYLIQNQKLPISRNQLLEKVWGYEADVEGRLVDDVIKRLRKKMVEQGASAEISTVWGYGYKLEEAKY